MCLNLKWIGLFLSVFVFVLVPDSGALEVEEQCAPVSEEPFEYEGELLLSGRQGIHAIRADSETNLIRIFHDERWATISGGLSLSFQENHYYAFSPNKERVAFLEGDYFCSGHCHSGLFRTLRIFTYNPRVRGVVQMVPYEFTYDIGYFDGEHRHFSLFWLDDSRLILPEPGVNTAEDRLPSPVAVNVDTGEVEALDWGEFPLYSLEAVSFSPDRSLVYTYDYEQSTYALMDVVTGESLLVLPHVDNYEHAWSHDGKTFAIGTVGEDHLQLSFVNLETFEIDIINPDFAPHFQGHDLTTLRWSPNNRYLAYIDSRREPGQAWVEQIHIVDTEAGVIYNTCLRAKSLAWSPDGTQLAFNAYNIGLRNPVNQTEDVNIFDLDTWETHLVGTHVGHLLHWID